MKNKTVPLYHAYVSEPITRCPVREKGRIQTLIGKIGEALALDPFSTQLYVPSYVTAPGVRGMMSPQHVYLLDRIRIVEADFLLVVADQTSFGIGGEVEMASTLGKPVVIFSRAEKVSRFLLGTPVNAVRQVLGQDFIHYQNWRDLKPKLLKVVSAIIQRLNRDEMERLPRWDLGERLRQLRDKQGLSVEELARQAGLQAEQVTLWEKTIDEVRHEFLNYHEEEGLDLGPIQLTPRRQEQLANPGLAALHRLAFALKVPVGQLLGEPDKPLPLKGPGKLVEAQKRQVRERRLAQLEHLAAKFDVTFREFQSLRRSLVDEILEGSLLPERAQDVLTEEEMQTSLLALRKGIG